MRYRYQQQASHYDCIPEFRKNIPITSADELRGDQRVSSKPPRELEEFIRQSVESLWNQSNGKTYVGAPHGSPE